jgi:hypothetical protein
VALRADTKKPGASPGFCAYRYIVYKLFRTHTLQFPGIGGTDYAVERKYEDG